jgi:hypothetical protein
MKAEKTRLHSERLSTRFAFVTFAPEHQAHVMLGDTSSRAKETFRRLQTAGS